MKQMRHYCSAADKLRHDPACKEEIMAMARQEKIHISKRGIITGTAAAAVLLAVNIGVGSFLYSQHKALDTASNEPAEVSEYEVKEAPVQTTAAAEQTVTETTATTAKEKTERTTTAKNQKEAKTTTVVKQDKQTAVTTAAKNSNQTAATTAAPKSTVAAPKATTAAPKVTTAAPKNTTAKRTTTTAKHTTTTAKQTTAAPTTTTAVQKPPVTDRLTYNLVPADKTGWTSAYENDLANNVYRAQPGEQLRVDLKVKNDPGTYFLMMSFDFGGVQQLRAEYGSAYAGQHGPSLLGNDDLSLPQTIDLMGKMSDMHAADDSVIVSYYVKVPQNAGRYTLTLEGVNGEVRSLGSDGGEKGYRNFTFYGLDILVGDTPLPGTADPIISEPYYAAEDTPNNQTNEGDPYQTNEGDPYSGLLNVPAYDSPAEAGNTMAVCVESITAHAGDKHVPVRVYVKNNAGVVSLGLRLIHSSGISVEANGRKPDFTLDSAYADCLALSSLNDEENIWGFSVIGDEGVNSDGTILTFYVDIPDNASAGDVFKISTHLEDLITGRLMNLGDICTVNGFVRVVE